MAKTDFKSIDEYHNNFSGETLARMQTIRQLVHQVAPVAKEVISYQIPAFKIGDKFYLIYYAAFAKHLTLASPWSEALLREFADDLKGMKVSKSAIQLPLDQPLPIELIALILKFRKREYDQPPKPRNY
jgi:uncharacterized protein YdhG (YjbR/CyaY superfamily)